MKNLIDLSDDVRGKLITIWSSSGFLSFFFLFYEIYLILIAGGIRERLLFTVCFSQSRFSGKTKFRDRNCG